jgi:hypothetical protein
MGSPETHQCPRPWAPRHMPSETRGGARAAAGQVASERCAVCNPSLASNPAKPGTMPAEWLKLLRAARASRQVAGLPYAQVRAWGNLRLAHWPISGSRLGRPGRGASQVGVVQRRKSVQRSRRPIAAATLTITRLQKDHDLRPLTPAARISAVNRRVPVRCPITRQQIQALTCPATRRSRSIRRPRVLGMRNAGPAVAYGNRAAAMIVRVAT